MDYKENNDFIDKIFLFEWRSIKAEVWVSHKKVARGWSKTFERPQILLWTLERYQEYLQKYQD